MGDIKSFDTTRNAAKSEREIIVFDRYGILIQEA